MSWLFLIKSQIPVRTRKYPTQAAMNTSSVRSWIMKVPVVAPENKLSRFTPRLGLVEVSFGTVLIPPEASYVPTRRC